jgi:hypothetical protein
MDPLCFEVTLDTAAGGGIKMPYDIRALFGKARVPFAVTVALDDQPRVVTTPADLGAAIDDAGSGRAGTGSPTHTSGRT